MKEGEYMINSKFLRTSRGFTLIEVLLSLTILGIVLTSTMSFFSQAYTYTKMNENKTVGINVARNVLYYMEQLEFDKVFKYVEDNSFTAQDIPIDCDSTVIQNKDVCEGIFNTSLNNEDFTTTVSVNFHESLKEYLIPVKVKVEWGENNSAEVEGVIKK